MFRYGHVKFGKSRMFRSFHVRLEVQMSSGGTGCSDEVR